MSFLFCLTSLLSTAAAHEETKVNLIDGVYYAASPTENCDKPSVDTDDNGKPARDDEKCACMEINRRKVCLSKTLAELCGSDLRRCTEKGSAIRIPAFDQFATSGAEGSGEFVPLWEYFYFDMEILPGFAVGVGGNLPPGMLIVDENPDVVINAIESGEGEVSFAMVFPEGFGAEGVQLKISDQEEYGRFVIAYSPANDNAIGGPAGVINLLY